MTALAAFIRRNSSFNPSVILFTLAFLIFVIGFSAISPGTMKTALDQLKEMIFAGFSWFYILVFSVFLFFLVFLSIGNMGNIKLGTDEEEPEFPFLSWLAMLFAAGMGVGLMFFGVAEPLSHYVSPLVKGDGGMVRQNAMLHTFFHWGIHAWSVYGIIALALAYFGFRYRLPLALRSCFYPLLKDRIYGRAGDVIDIMALCATLFGIITTLGFGAAQMSAGLQQMGWLGESGFGTQVLVIVVVMGMAVASAASGVGRGVKILSEINLILAVLLMIFVLLCGPTLHLLSAFSDNMGFYLSNLLKLSFKTYVYEPENTGWFTGWTVLYWAWWCSWAPFVGLFIARISRGRTVREFVFGVLVIPSLFSVLWFTIFGNSAIWFDEHVAGGALGALTGQPEKLLFVFLAQLPWPQISGTLAVAVIALFFITSADSGIYVLNNISSRDKSLLARRWQAPMWGLLIALAAIALLRTGGLAALQSMTLIVALPFAMLMLLMCMSLWRGMLADRRYFEAQLTHASVFWSGRHWRTRLGQMLSQTQQKDVLRFLSEVALPAMQQLQSELVTVHGLRAEIRSFLESEKPALELHIGVESMHDFIYGIRSVSREVSERLVDDGELPHIQRHITHEPLTYFADGRSGYDVQYMDGEELIADILKQYERYLSLMHHAGEDIMSHERHELGE